MMLISDPSSATAPRQASVAHARQRGMSAGIKLQRWEKTQRLGRCAIYAHPFRCALPAQGCAQ
jgi:hypothetical protein